MNIKKISIILCFLVLDTAIQPNVTTAIVHTEGANVLHNGTVYFIPPAVSGPASGSPLRTQLIPYPSAEVFLSYGFNSWNTVVPATVEDLELPKSEFPMFYAGGTLVNDKGTIYLIVGSTRYGIPNTQVFQSYSYKWESVISGDTSMLLYTQILPLNGPHLAGSLINNAGTVNYISDFGRILIPSVEVFKSWGFQWRSVVSPNKADSALLSEPPVTMMSIRRSGELAPKSGKEPQPQ